MVPWQQLSNGTPEGKRFTPSTIVCVVFIVETFTAEANYDHAIALLTQRYGQSHKIVQAHMQALLEINTPTNTMLACNSIMIPLNLTLEDWQHWGKLKSHMAQCLFLSYLGSCLVMYAETLLVNMGMLSG